MWAPRQVLLTTVIGVVTVTVLINASRSARFVFPDDGSGSLVGATSSSQETGGRSSCVTPPTNLTFWTSDLHDMIRTDLASSLPGLGHQLVLAGHKGRNLPYPEVLQNPAVLQPARPLSPQIQRGHQDSNSPWTEAEARALFEYYKTDPQIAGVDAFVCMFPASYCEAWLPFNKSIIFVAAHRYSLGRCALQRWQRLNEHLQAMSNADARGHVVAGITQYDVEYINYFTGLRPVLLPVTALWYVNPAAHPYTKSRPEILIGPLQRTSYDRMDELSDAAAGRVTFGFAKQIYGRYTLSHVAQHRAMLVLPYATTSGGLIEVYALGVPLFVPDPAFLLELGTMNDRRMRDGFYCGPSVQLPPKHNASRHPHSPEDADEASFMYWIKYCDFYTWPHITQFSSWEDLVTKLLTADFDGLRAAMLKENARRKQQVKGIWGDVACRVPRNSPVPASYEAGVREALGADRLFVD